MGKKNCMDLKDIIRDHRLELRRLERADVVLSQIAEAEKLGLPGSQGAAYTGVIMGYILLPSKPPTTALQQMAHALAEASISQIEEELRTELAGLRTTQAVLQADTAVYPDLIKTGQLSSPSLPVASRLNTAVI
jgi:hypothetical protein